jgi:integrase
MAKRTGKLVATGIEEIVWENKDGTTTKRYVAKLGRGKGRQQKQFKLKKDAQTWYDATKAALGKGIKVRESKAPTVREAGERWIATCRSEGLEKVSVDDYQNNLDLHVYPFLGNMKVTDITVGVVKKWQTDLRNHEEPRSQSMVKRVTIRLGSLLADAVENGVLGHNAVYSLKAGRKKGKERRAERREKGKLQVGKDIPTPKEVDAILAAASDDKASPMERALYLVMFRCGLRASELRGLIWSSVDLDRGELHVNQRADRECNIGKPKSESAYRKIPISPSTLLALKEWRLQCPRRDTGRTDADGNPVRELHYVFPNGNGKVENRSNLATRLWIPTQVRAGVSVQAVRDGKRVVDENLKPIMVAKYPGLHASRHFFASWCINLKVDGGLEYPPRPYRR